MTETQAPDIWADICARAGIDRESDEVGYPVSVPQTWAVDWLTAERKALRFEVGQAMPFMPSHKIIAIFEEDFVSRVYAVPSSKSEKDEENFSYRWSVRTTAPTQSLTRFLDTDTLLDALAAELVEYVGEFDELPESEPGLPPPDATQPG